MYVRPGSNTGSRTPSPPWKLGRRPVRASPPTVGKSAPVHLQRACHHRRADMSQPRGGHHADRDPECGDLTSPTHHRMRESSGVHTEVASSRRLVDLTHPCGSTHSGPRNSDRVQGQKQFAAAPRTKRNANLPFDAAKRLAPGRPTTGASASSEAAPGTGLCPLRGTCHKSACSTEGLPTKAAVLETSDGRAHPCRESVITAERPRTCRGAWPALSHGDARWAATSWPRSGSRLTPALAL